MKDVTDKDIIKNVNAIFAKLGDKLGWMFEEYGKVHAFGYKLIPGTYGHNENCIEYKDGKYYLNNKLYNSK